MKRIVLITILLNLAFNGLVYSQREKKSDSINMNLADRERKESYLSPYLIEYNNPPSINTRNLDGEEFWILGTFTTSIVMGESDFAHIRYIQEYDVYGNRVKLIIKELRNEDPIAPTGPLSDDWKDTDYYAFFYNRQKTHLLDSMLFYHKFDGENLNLVYKTSYVYDENENNTEMTTLITEIAKANRMYSSKYLRTYDSNNNMLTDFLYREDEKRDWKISIRDYYEYDANNNVTKEDRYNLDNSVVYCTIDHTYDENNNLTESIYYYTDEKRTVVDAYSYDEKGNLLSEKVAESYDASAKWDSISRHENFYNDKGLLEEEVCYLWNNAQERYLSYHYFFNYDENNVLTSILEEETNIWYAGLTEKIYDEAYNIVEERKSTKRPESEDWILYDRLLWEYDPYKNCIESKELRLPIGATEWKPFGGSHLFTYNNGKSRSSVGTSVWRATYSYIKSDEVANENITKQSKESISVFPNPVTDIANISFKADHAETIKIKLFDLSGKLIYQTVDPECKEGNIIKTIPMNHLNSGIYIIHVGIGNKTISKKIIKQ